LHFALLVLRAPDVGLFETLFDPLFATSVEAYIRCSAQRGKL
jgi:hypothetical protein